VHPPRLLVTVLTIGALSFSGLAHYTVRQGDTLSSIARRFGVSVGALAEANRITDPDLVIAGKRLRIPGAGTDTTSGFVYVVRSGDTLSTIAWRFSVSIPSLMKANGLGSANQLRRGQRLVIPTARPRPAASGVQVKTLLERTAARYGWNPALIKAVAMVESGWNNGVVSDSGAFGIMQVLPDTGRFVSRHLAGRPLDLRDPADNVEAGVAFLDYLHGLTNGDVRLTLGSYYQGLASIRQHGMYPDTANYVNTVLAVRNRY
jgi:N-acetylmuramoyl-L-alanine amidase